jgi:glucose-1-phosphate cytidylyltransferase
LLTGTGARVHHVSRYMDGDLFALTYADGIGTCDLSADFEFHNSHGAIGTVTAVHPTSRYGEMHIDGDRVIEFNEKPTMADGFASGGFFFFDRRFLNYITDDPALLLEEEPLRKLARDGQLRHVVHEGFWMGMDTFRDYTALNELWRSGEAPWKVWPDR